MGAGLALAAGLTLAAKAYSEKEGYVFIFCCNFTSRRREGGVGVLILSCQKIFLVSLHKKEGYALTVHILLESYFMTSRREGDLTPRRRGALTDFNSEVHLCCAVPDK